MVLLLFYVPTIFVGVLCRSLFWYALLHALSSFAIILTRKKELNVLLVLSFGSVALPQGAVFFMQFLIVVFPDHTHLLLSLASYKIKTPNQPYTYEVSLII